jgi:hypothetical protein
MKKIVLFSALALATITANAQGGGWPGWPGGGGNGGNGGGGNSQPSVNPSTAERCEDDANLYITMNLHNWIDIDNENTSLMSSEPNSWSDLNNGWTVGNAPFNLSATRNCKVAISSTSVRETGHAGSDQSGWYFPATYLSLEAGASSLSSLPGITVTGPGFSDAWSQINHLSSSNQDCYTSNQGMYVRRLTPSIGAFKHDASGTYYTLNLHGGTYKGTVTFTATLN